jgi:hypothetical protein
MARSKMMKNPWSIADCHAAVPTEASVMWIDGPSAGLQRRLAGTDQHDR